MGIYLLNDDSSFSSPECVLQTFSIFKDKSDITEAKAKLAYFNNKKCNEPPKISPFNSNEMITYCNNCLFDELPKYQKEMQQKIVTKVSINLAIKN